MGGGVGLPPASLGDMAAIAAFANMAAGDTKMRSAKRSVEIADSKRKYAIKCAKEALERAQKAQKKSGFWSKVGKVAGVVATVAAAGSAVFTAGTGAVAAVAIAGALLSTSSMVMKATDIDADLGEVGGFKFKLSDVFALAGLSAGVAGAGAASEGAKRSVGLANTGVLTATTAVQAGAKYGETQATGDVVDEHANAKLHDIRATDQSDQAEQEIGIIQQIVEDKRKAMQAIAGILDAQRAANAAINRRLA
jgi:hypothetical protein